MRNQKGQVLIEAAIILPILLVLIFGIIDYSLAMFTQNILTNVAGTGARAAAVFSSLKPDTTDVLLNDINTNIGTAIKSDLIYRIPFSFYKNKAAGSVHYKLEIFENSGLPITGTAQSGNTVRVTLSWPNFPTITPLYKMTSSTPLTLTGVASMRYE